MSKSSAHAMRAPFPYFGGKQLMAPTLLDLMPPHDVYVEVFGGSGALLFAKRPSKLEVYNDLDSGLVNFFRILRSHAQSTVLKRSLRFTPYGREEWEMCRATWRYETEPIEKARRWFVALNQSFSKTPTSQGWSYCKQPSGHAVSKFRGYVAQIEECAERMQLVQVEQIDALDLIRRYDAPNVLFYVDPPYLPETRKGHGYHHELSAEDHEALLATLTAARGMVMLSGYRSPMYDAALADWRRVDHETVNWSANKKRDRRVECIWLSPNCTAAHPDLWAS